MARTVGSGRILEAAAQWKERCLIGDGSVFRDDRELWTAAHVDELDRDFVQRLDAGPGSFMTKLEAQLAASSDGAKQLASELLWAMLLFPSNITGKTKAGTIAQVWAWSGETLRVDEPQFAALEPGIGSAGTGYNNYRPHELVYFIRLLQPLKALPPEERRRLLSDPWAFSDLLEPIKDNDNRQLRHMLLHLLFPDAFERVSSKGNKVSIAKAFAADLGISRAEAAGANLSWTEFDRRLLQLRQKLEAEHPGIPLDYYEPPLTSRWKDEERVAEQAPRATEKAAEAVAPNGLVAEEPSATWTGSLVSLSEVAAALKSDGLRLSPRTIRRYHLALNSRGFVILAGISGSGKTWLAQAYAKAIGARSLVVPVAPNWTSNEDLLGYVDFNNTYRHTVFSRFLETAAKAYDEASKAGVHAQPFHLILDEMNLARVEHYFAKFLSAMELRQRGPVEIELGGGHAIHLPPNLAFIGTVNVDETTHGFADKVFDRAQLIEVGATREDVEAHLGSAPYSAALLALWDTLHDTAPFAFRVIDDIAAYVRAAEGIDAPADELLDEQILQKVLPKLRGTDARVGRALERVTALTANLYPLSHAKAQAMSQSYAAHGIASFF